MLADAIALGIDLLDQMEAGREDLEPDLAGSYNPAYPLDAEGPDLDLEPMLGAVERHPVSGGFTPVRYATRGVADDQRRWAEGSTGVSHDECEEEDEHGGDVLNEPHDGEPDGEPSLGATEAINQSSAWRQTGESMWTSTGEAEPSLGSIGSCYGQSIPQTDWAHGNSDDREGDDSDLELSGDENDAALGATHAVNQLVAWSAAGPILWGSHPNDESEPSLGWSNEHGYPEAVPFGGNDDREHDDEREHDPAEMGIADHHALAIELSEGGGDLPCLDQSKEGVSNVISEDRRSFVFAGVEGAIAAEQLAMRDAVARLSATVVRIRGASAPREAGIPGVLDIVGPAALHGEFARIVALR
jgi:hypothetical protein